MSGYLIKIAFARGDHDSFTSATESQDAAIQEAHALAMSAAKNGYHPKGIEVVDLAERTIVYEVDDIPPSRAR